MKKKNECCLVTKFEFYVKEVRPIRKLQPMLLVHILFSKTIFRDIFKSKLLGLWFYGYNLDRDLILTESLRTLRWLLKNY